MALGTAVSGCFPATRSRIVPTVKSANEVTHRSGPRSAMRRRPLSTLSRHWFTGLAYMGVVPDIGRACHEAEGDDAATIAPQNQRGSGQLVGDALREHSLDRHT